MTNEELLARAKALADLANHLSDCSDYTESMLSVTSEVRVSNGNGLRVCWRAHMGTFSTYPRCCSSVENALDCLESVMKGQQARVGEEQP